MARRCGRRVRVARMAAALALVAIPAAAQPIETVGVRAQGMAGAFVAVADDASAVYWNPAALAKGPYVGGVLERTSGEADPKADQGAPDASWRSATLVAIAVPSLGVSYLRSKLVRAPAAAVPAGTGPGEEGPGLPAGSSLTAHQVGATILQSLSDNVIVGTTLKWVRGVAAAGPVDGAADNGARLDQVRAFEGAAGNAFDLDVGLLAVVQRVRLGLVAKNLRAPTFEAPDGTLVGLEQQVRAGVAVPAGPAVLVAADVDLRTTTDVDGARRRRVSLGAEGRVNEHLVLRGGLGVAVSGGRRTTAAGGASVALGRFWIDGQLTQGEHGQDAWSVGLRIQY